MRAWLLTCMSGREFIVYAPSDSEADEKFAAIMPGEEVRFVNPHETDSTIAIVDARKTPGA